DHPAQKEGVTRKELDEIGCGSPVAHISLPWGEALRKRNLWMIMLMYHTYCWGSYFYLSWLHTYLTLGRGLTQDEMKVYSTLPFIAGAIGNLVGGSVSDILTRRYGLRFGRVSIGTLGLAVSAFCILGTALTGSKYVAVALLTFGYFSMDCMLPAAWSLCMDVGKRHAGAVSGAMNMAGQFGSFLSSVAFGYLVESWKSYNTPLILFAAMLAISSFLFTRINPEEPLVAEAADPPVRLAA
ncbi:MAG TPA: MFS transporter, partial [Bryobacteraceae bacterium]|nr:MFS transporter [Bryobacteraceae bacterium]